MPDVSIGLFAAEVLRGYMDIETFLDGRVVELGAHIRQIILVDGGNFNEDVERHLDWIVNYMGVDLDNQRGAESAIHWATLKWFVEKTAQ